MRAAQYLVGTTGYPRGFPPNSNMKSGHEVARKAFQSVEKFEGNNNQPHKTSILFMTFGQFIDHDITGTDKAPTGGCDVTCKGATGGIEHQYPCNPIYKDQSSTGAKRCTKLTRTQAACRSSSTEIREQVNFLTSFIDGSAVYGSSDKKMQFLRTNDGSGKLRTTTGDLLPEDEYNNEPCNNEGFEGCFATGDKRGSENPALAGLHTLWVREHNRIATELKELNKYWSGSKIFWTTRKIVAAEMQNILLNEWLPMLFDTNDIDGYDTDVDPSISNVFAHSVFRFGHTLVPDKFPLYDNNFNPYAAKPILTLREGFHHINPIKNHGIEPIMYGLIGNESETFDTKFAQAISRHLFIPLGEGGLADLTAINIHRGRDHGLPPYNEWRQFCGFSKLKDWDDLNGDMESETIKNLKKVYTSVEEIDIFVGGIGEKPVHEKVIGKTFGCIMKKQFKDLFKGDRYFYTNYVFDYPQTTSIGKVTMRQVLCDNLKGVVSLHANPFVPFDDGYHTRHACQTDYRDPHYEGANLDLWKDITY
ncbi:myeloperoxidase-like [Clytia hemisphaerica]|uniref:myeloperoxidase-like n=1 Tax=Clytia hemisphaerica TaxID=252671 RepID=UPI0034D48230